MAGSIEMKNGRGQFPWRAIGWGGVVVLLLLPLVAGAPWTLSDYVAAGVMLGISGLLLEMLVRLSPDLAYRAGAAMAVGTALLLVWVNLAVGFLGNEDNPANLMFLGIILVAAVGAVFSGFRARGMAATMFVAAALQLLAGIVGLSAGWGGSGPTAMFEAAATIIFSCLWLIAGGLFRNAAIRQAETVQAL